MPGPGGWTTITNIDNQRDHHGKERGMIRTRWTGYRRWILATVLVAVIAVAIVEMG